MNGNRDSFETEDIEEAEAETVINLDGLRASNLGMNRKWTDSGPKHDNGPITFFFFF